MSSANESSATRAIGVRFSVVVVIADQTRGYDISSMSNEPPRFGPWGYGHKASDVFLDQTAGTINFDYFKPYFDQVALPLELAQACLGRSYSQWQRAQQGC